MPTPPIALTLNVRVLTPRQTPWHGTVTVPGDKSLSHRALILAAMAHGTSYLEGLLDSADVRNTANILQCLGAQFAGEWDRLQVTGWGKHRCAGPLRLDCGNSGTTMRLMAGVLAAGQGVYTLFGDASLNARPMLRIAAPLRQLGATIEVSQQGTAPVHIVSQPLQGTTCALAVPSAQVKSCLLLAGLQAQGETVITGDQGSRDHTERLLQALGVQLGGREGTATLRTQPGGGSGTTARCTQVSRGAGTTVRGNRVGGEPVTGATRGDQIVDYTENLVVPGGQSWPGFAMRIPRDPSSAAFPVALAVLVPGSAIEVPDLGLNPTRLGFFRILQRMGARVSWQIQGEEMGEPWGIMRAEYSELRALNISPQDIPGTIDELPLLAVVAASAQGVTRVQGAGELCHKECDRLRATAQELSKMGVDIRIEGEGWIISGPTIWRNATVSTWGDHRLEMSLAVAASLGPSERHTILEGSGCQAISWPAFWDCVWGGMP